MNMNTTNPMMMMNDHEDYSAAAVALLDSIHDKKPITITSKAGDVVEPTDDGSSDNDNDNDDHDGTGDLGEGGEGISEESTLGGEDIVVDNEEGGDGGEEVAAAEEAVIKSQLRPSEVVSSLDSHIVGQNDAKRAVAIAMRNRWRRRQLPKDLMKEVTPRNVLMIGPTGCG